MKRKFFKTKISFKTIVSENVSLNEYTGCFITSGIFDDYGIVRGNVQYLFNGTSRKKMLRNTSAYFKIPYTYLLCVGRGMKHPVYYQTYIAK